MQTFEAHMQGLSDQAEATAKSRDAQTISIPATREQWDRACATLADHRGDPKTAEVLAILTAYLAG